MTNILIDTTPKPFFLLAEQHAKWTVPGAISELVDNAFGPQRGNAKRVVIAYDKQTRTITIFDNGAGMDDIGRLFQLGNTVGRSPDDIGIYGAGGTKALLWLGRTVKVSSLHKGMVSRAEVTWNDLMQGEKLRPIPGTKQKATATNTPKALFNAGHGTLIRIELLKTRKVYPDRVQQALAKTYAPAIREGRLLQWAQTEVGKDARSFLLADPYQFAKSVDLNFTIEHDGLELRVKGKVGIVDGELTVSENRVAVGFGPRVIFTTRDCFSSGREHFSGKGITGWVQLGEGWPFYMTTMKDAIDDLPLLDVLMENIFGAIRPLLVEVEDEAMTLVMNDLAINLEIALNASRNINVKVGDELDGTQRLRPGHQEDDPTLRPGPGPFIIPDDDGEEHNKHKLSEDGTNEKRPAATSIRIDLRTDTEMEGVLCLVSLQRSGFEVKVNKDHWIVEEALKTRPINRVLLNLLVTRELAAALASDQKACVQVLGSRTAAQFTDIDQERRNLSLARHLIDRCSKPQLDAAE